MQYVQADGIGRFARARRLKMYFKQINRFQWVLSGTLTASLALTPAALVQSAYAQQQQGAAADQQAPAPGAQGNWGQAGPPPDAVNGQIPPPDNSAQQDPSLSQDTSEGPPQYPGQAGQNPAQDPSQGSNQGPGQYPSQAPPANGGGVGYGQAPRPAYQPNGQYPANRYQQQQAPPPAPPSGPVTLTSGVLLPIRTSEPLDSKKVKPGDFFQGTVAQSVYVGNVVAIPRGAQVTGRVVDVKKPGELKGGASIALQLTTLNLGGNSYALATDIYNTNSPGKGGYTAGNAVGGAALGAVIGAIAGGGPGAAIGAVAGTGVGLGASAATPGPRSVLPPEALITFHLTTPATVQPLSPQDAYQLEASSAPQGQGPGYDRRQPPPYGYAPGYGPGPGYGYAAPYPGPVVYGYPYGYAYPRYYYGRPYYYGRYR
jgi:hypothetical protein